MSSVPSEPSQQERVPYATHSEANQWLDEQYGAFAIDDERFFFSRSASEILYEMDYPAYLGAINAFQSMQIDELIETVTERFPLPIAVCFFRTNQGFENAIQRLSLLRDTWEALVLLLFAITVGESRYMDVSFRDAGVTMDLLFSEKLSDKLTTVRRLLEYSASVGIALYSSQVIYGDVLSKVERLNKVRNGFSHEAAKSEIQANALFAQHVDDVLSVLHDVLALQDITLLRYIGAGGNALSPRFERFRGSRMVREIRETPLSVEQITQSSACLNSDMIAVKFGDRIFSLTPFVHFKQDDTGHRTELCFLKQKVAPEMYRYEVVGLSEKLDLPRSDFGDHVNELRTLIQQGTKHAAV